MIDKKEPSVRAALSLKYVEKSPETHYNRYGNYCDY